MAVVPDMESATRGAIVEALAEQVREGEILTRYMAVCSDSAFVVFSTQEHAERIRSAVLVYDEAWMVQDYDVSDYQQYTYFHPQINGTVFPAEKITDLTVRTIPESGLQLLMDKAVQLNLANKRQSIDYYYYRGSYVYTHFTSGKECVFQLNDNEEIISCRSVASAEANWNLPPFFVLEASG